MKLNFYEFYFCLSIVATISYPVSMSLILNNITSGLSRKKFKSIKRCIKTSNQKSFNFTWCDGPCANNINIIGSRFPQVRHQGVAPKCSYSFSIATKFTQINSGNSRIVGMKYVGKPFLLWTLCNQNNFK